MSPIWNQYIMKIAELGIASAVSMRVKMLQEQRAGVATSAVELRNGEGWHNVTLKDTVFHPSLVAATWPIPIWVQANVVPLSTSVGLLAGNGVYW